MSRIPDSELQIARRDAASVFSDLMDFHARHARWKEALPNAAKAVEFEPASVVLYLSRLALLAAHGDLENYRFYCQEILHRFRDQPHHGEAIAKLCLMLPSSGVDLALAERMADGGLTARINSRDAFISYGQFAKGLAEYRQGRFGSAADWMRKSIADPFYGAGHSRYVQSYMVLAMAYHQLNENEEARAALTKGREIEQAKLPRIDGGDLGPGWYWRDWIIAHVLMDEAKALIEGQPSRTKEPTQSNGLEQPTPM